MLTLQEEIKNNLYQINSKIDEACKKADRTRDSVKLMAVSKFHPSEAVWACIEQGQFLFGENRVQEAFEKFPTIIEKNPNVRMEIIGQLQTNKVKNAVKIAECIQSVDRIQLINEIEKQSSKLNKTIEVLFEVHTGEESKSGFTSEEEIIKCLDDFANGKYPHVIPRGFMTMAPFTEDEKLIHKSFTTLRELSLRMQEQYKMLELKELSMGMSGDFEIAIEEGSTLIRVGTAIFGKRNYN